jgi:CO/xanthine dehydrogenase FAD-binding subunit
VSVVRATSVLEAQDALSRLPGAVLVAGGTEVVPALRSRPAPHLVTLRRVAGLTGVQDEGPTVVRLGALTTYTALSRGAGGVALLTAMAATVGSPASRNAGTLGGALGTASGAGDAVTALLALDAVVLVAGASGQREVPVAAWLDGSGRAPGDVLTGVDVPRTTGSQHYLKPGERRAVYSATVSCALVVDAGARAVRCALGSVAGSPVRVADAEDWVASTVLWEGDVPRATPDQCAEFGRRVAAGLPAPQAGLRVSPTHRRHVAGILAQRALARAAA